MRDALHAIEIQTPNQRRIMSFLLGLVAGMFLSGGKRAPTKADIAKARAREEEMLYREAKRELKPKTSQSRKESPTPSEKRRTVREYQERRRRSKSSRSRSKSSRRRSKSSRRRSRKRSGRRSKRSC
jgi:hypothetical protein